MTADYNGWNDLPEAEREALDEVEDSSDDHHLDRAALPGTLTVDRCYAMEQSLRID